MLKYIILFFSILFLIGVIIKMFISKSMPFFLYDYPFECGISSNSSARKPFSLPFFLITIIFLMFDLEILLIFPLIFFSKNVWLVTMFLCIMSIFMATLYLEWLYGSLKWINC